MKSVLFINLASFLTLISISVFAQNSKHAGFEYLSPIPNSKYVSPYTNFIIRQGEFINEANIKSDLLQVTGAKSGLHKGKLSLLDDSKTIIFKPATTFTQGEIVKVRIRLKSLGLAKYDGADFYFEFLISSSWKENNKQSSRHHYDEVSSSINLDSEVISKHFKPKYLGVVDTLPADYPEYYITTLDNPSEGYIFTSPYSEQFIESSYMIIMDNYGIPIFYRKYSNRIMDFKLNGSGFLTFYFAAERKFYELDSSYAIVDTFACGNGYWTDEHDLQILDNGHSLLMSYDEQTVRMDTIVAGGDSAANVIGLIIQELDENKIVIFQWRSWDHFQITDATYDVDLTAHTIDYVHGNSVELDYDGNLIISSRHMDEITKISRATGEIIWRLGGENNQFQFVNDPRGFSHQHDARRISNGNLTLLDNGNLINPQLSYSLEYNLNETDKIATLIWNYSDYPTYSDAMANSQRLDNGRTIIGWGHILNPAITEVKNDGTKTFELFYESSYSYRAFRFPWRTNLLTADNYRIDFEYIPVNITSTKEVTITNNSDEDLEISSYYSRTLIFTVTDIFPIHLQPYENKILQIQFSPDSVGVFSDDIHLRIQKEGEMVAQVIKVLGYSDPNASVEIEKNYLDKYELFQNYPNPFNPNTTIIYKIPQLSFVSIKLYDVLGNEIETLVSEEKPAGTYEITWSAGNLPSGVYFYQLRAGKYTAVKKMVLLK